MGETFPLQWDSAFASDSERLRTAVTALLSDLVVLGLVASNGDGTARIRGDIYREVVQRLVAGGAPREPNSAAFALLAFVVHDGLRWHLSLRKSLCPGLPRGIESDPTFNEPQPVAHSSDST
jgi:hypothetical protein